MLVICCMRPAKTGATFLFDFIHNLKSIFNNFLSKGRMHIPIVSFEDILGLLAWVCLVM